MLIYLGTGMRRYGVTPYEPMARRYWEFQAVLSGRIGMTEPGRETRLKNSHLWLSPPGHVHGWTGDGRKQAEVAVFQFPSVPEPLRRLVDGAGALELSLSPEACRRIRELRRQAQAYFQHPSTGMVMCYEHVLLELSLLIYEARRDLAEGAGADNDRRVGNALSWYAQHLESNPSLDEVAAAVNVSTSHLRRLFHGVLQAAPKPVFDGIRFQRAIQMMSEPAMKLSEISVICGFESQSAFSRAFKAKFGCAPHVWRGEKPANRSL